MLPGKYFQIFTSHGKFFASSVHCSTLCSSALHSSQCDGTLHTYALKIYKYLVQKYAIWNAASLSCASAYLCVFQIGWTRGEQVWNHLQVCVLIWRSLKKTEEKDLKSLENWCVCVCVCLSSVCFFGVNVSVFQKGEPWRRQSCLQSLACKYIYEFCVCGCESQTRGSAALVELTDVHTGSQLWRRGHWGLPSLHGKLKIH